MEIREALEAAVSEAEKEVPNEPVAVATEPAASEPVAAASEPAGETEAQRTERLRDEKGRFAEGKAEVKAPPKEPQAQVAPTQAAAPIPRPSSWEKAMWPIWDKLNAGTPLDAKEARQLAEYSNKREGDYAKGVSTYKQEWDNAKPVVEAIAPFLPVLQQHNIQPAQWISNLGRAHHTLATGDNNSKLQAFAKLANEYGVPLQALYDPSYAQQFVAQSIQQRQPQIPVEQLVAQEVNKFRTQDSIQQFAEAKDGSGNSLHPHFEAVRQQMGQLLDAGLAQDLNDAYSKALRMNDDLWQAEQDAKRKADETARLEAQRKATAAAKANAVSVRSATPATAGAGANKGSVRSALEAAVEQHVGGRV